MVEERDSRSYGLTDDEDPTEYLDLFDGYIDECFDFLRSRQNGSPSSDDDSIAARVR